MAESSTYREIGDYIMNTDLGKCLGRTPKVIVYPGEHKTRDVKVAGKMFVWDRDFPTDVVDREVENMRAIPDHENVLKLLDYVKVDVGKFKELWLIMELCPNGHVGEFAKTRNLSLPQKVDLMLQSAKGVQHLHHLEKPMIHRDLKPANLLLTGRPEHPLVKVADFGESTYFEGSQKHSVRHMTATGTPYYQAPELFSDKESNRPAQNKAVDTFALGVSFLHLLDAEKGVASDPIKVGNEVLGLHMHQNPDTDVRQLLIKPRDSDDVKQVKSLICDMLARDPESRILIDAVVERLRGLRTSLGVKALVSVDTVWDKPVFYWDTELLDSIKTKIASQQSPVTTDPQQSPGTTDPQQSPVTTDPQHSTVTIEPPNTNAAIKMEHVERIISANQDVLDQLTQLLVGGDTEDRLLVVDVRDNRGVWMYEGTEWESVSDVPDECPKYGVCMCRVSDGFIVCGGSHGTFDFEPSVSQCHHFSVLTRQWRKLRDMLTPRAYASAVEYDDMKIVVCGGLDSDYKTIAVCEILDCRNNKWSPAANMPEPLASPLIAAEAGRVFILPCDDGLNQPALLTYDPNLPSKKGIVARLTSTTGKHTYKSKLPKDVHSTEGACLVAGAHKLYLMGGEQELALEYNPWTDQWQHLTPPSLRYVGFGCCAAMTPGLIKLYGGSTGGWERNMVEVYDTHTQKWETLDMRLPFQIDYYRNLVARYDRV